MTARVAGRKIRSRFGSGILGPLCSQWSSQFNFELQGATPCYYRPPKAFSENRWSLFTGFLLVLIAALLQGSFILPMTFVKGWSWEHTWATFSFSGMLVFNWIITLLLVPDIFRVYGASPLHDLLVLALFGAGWGVGAVLFGLGMDRLGMALGYPVIMGLIAALGALIPLLVFFPQTLATAKGLVLLGGTALVIFGIAVCSIAGSRRTSNVEVCGARRKLP